MRACDVRVTEVNPASCRFFFRLCALLAVVAETCSVVAEHKFGGRGSAADSTEAISILRIVDAYV